VQAILLALLASSQARADQLPSGAVSLSAGELFSMYAGMTQSWPESSAGWYFSPDRKFAALGSGDETYAHGRWWITNSGKLCINVTWRWGRGADARNQERRCWGHAKVGQEVWKEYDGEWYEWPGEDELLRPGYTHAAEVKARAQRHGP
jgi:hypothetical protein